MKREALSRILTTGSTAHLIINAQQTFWLLSSSLNRRIHWVQEGSEYANQGKIIQYLISLTEFILPSLYYWKGFAMRNLCNISQWCIPNIFTMRSSVQPDFENSLKYFRTILDSQNLMDFILYSIFDLAKCRNRRYSSINLLLPVLNYHS